METPRLFNHYIARKVNTDFGTHYWVKALGAHGTLASAKAELVQRRTAIPSETFVVASHVIR